jgi:hypothetical protein
MRRYLLWIGWSEMPSSVSGVGQDRLCRHMAKNIHSIGNIWYKVLEKEDLEYLRIKRQVRRNV